MLSNTLFPYFKVMAIATAIACGLIVAIGVGTIVVMIVNHAIETVRENLKNRGGGG